jgi:small-conductance mechanosensitive channel
MIKLSRSLVALLVAVPLLCAQAAAATTQAPPEPPSRTQEQLTASVDTLAGKLRDIEKGVEGTNVTPASLTALASDVAPLAMDAQALVERLTPRAAAMKARLDQLGAKVAGEPADVTKQRETLQKIFDDNDGLLKRAKTLEVQATQDGAYIAKKQRALFTNSLFRRSISVLSPPLWFFVVREMPANVAAATRIFNDWLVGFNSNTTGGKLIVFWSLVLAVIVLYLPLTRVAKRVISHEAKVEGPTTWLKIVVACWTSFSVAGSIIAVMYGVIFVFSFFAAPDPVVSSLFTAMQGGIIRVAVAAGLARGILAPRRSKWRLVNFDDKTCDKLIRLIIAIAIIVSGSKVIEALNEAILADWRFSVAAQGVGALLVAAAMAAALIDLGDDPEAENPDADQSDTGGSMVKRRDYYGLIRGAAWTLIVCLCVASVVGYISFATFLVDQIVLVAGTLAVLFLLVRLIDKACELGFKPASVVGRNLIYTVGLRRETLGQLSILLSGLGRLVLFGLAAIVVIAPWGMQSTDITGNLRAIFFGFKIGDVTISIESIAVALISFLMVLAGTRAVQGWLEDRYLPQTRLDSGLRNSIKTSLGYVGFMLALTLAAANLGVDFQKLAIVAGALSVGIGFGLQSIVNNFVSGLILLWERAVRVGDWVVVGSDQGYVRKINVRSTEIETFDRASVIVPNSNLVSGVVKNLMRTDRVGRMTIEVTVNAAADPEKVREVLIDIARDNESVVSLPSPQVRFVNLTAGAMTFDLFCFVADVENMLRTKSDLYFEICRQFREHRFFDGPPADPLGINLVGLERLEAILQAQRAPDAAPPVLARKTG